MEVQVAVLPGDGIGPEVMEATLEVLEKVLRKSPLFFKFKKALVGGSAIDAVGHALPAQTLQLCEESHAILFGSVGGPKWESLPPELQPERAALLPLRRHFSLYANIRPVVLYPELQHVSPLKSEIIGSGVDIVILRELTGDVYFGEPKGRRKLGDEEEAFDTMLYRRYEIERIGHLAFELGRARKKKVHSIDKANVLTSMVFWREVISEIHKNYPDVELHHMYVDNAAMQLIRNPRQFDVILCPNMFGDILSDEASQLSGSLGMLPSASLGVPALWDKNGYRFGLYEPAGGTAPDIAGKGVANPIAQILSAALMLRYSFYLEKEATMIEEAVRRTISQGYRTLDIYAALDNTRKVSTQEMAMAIAANIDFS
ncbi:MAG: 3-isopropylmalate dehydrogenase [Leptospiraceae bacterium]|nr:3-isopropylmalate dehydrogenase [Leptospiraceae bacterium]MDW8307068.1 3-isopropylmalate dehydrogenase [Leptospiraceae bacterium]